MSIQQAHEKLGHISERATKEIAKKLMDNQPLNYAACMVGKGKQKSLKKVSVPDPKDEVNGDRANLNISMVKRNENILSQPIQIGN